MRLTLARTFMATGNSRGQTCNPANIITAGGSVQGAGPKTALAAVVRRAVSTGDIRGFAVNFVRSGCGDRKGQNREVLPEKRVWCSARGARVSLISRFASVCQNRCPANESYDEDLLGVILRIHFGSMRLHSFESSLRPAGHSFAARTNRTTEETVVLSVAEGISIWHHKAPTTQLICTSVERAKTNNDWNA